MAFPVRSLRKTVCRGAMPGCAGLCFRVCRRRDGYLDDTVGMAFEKAVGLVDAVEGVVVGDERGGVELASGDEAEDLGAVASVDAAGLERKVLAVHLWQGKNLRRVVKGHDGDGSVGTRAFPCRTE